MATRSGFFAASRSRRRRRFALPGAGRQRLGHDLQARPRPFRGELLALLGERDQQSQPAARQQPGGQAIEHARGEQHVLVARHRRELAGAGIDQHVAAIAAQPVERCRRTGDDGLLGDLHVTAAAQAGVERVAAILGLQLVDLGVGKPIERAAQDHLGAGGRMGGEQVAMSSRGAWPMVTMPRVRAMADHTLPDARSSARSREVAKTHAGPEARLQRHASASFHARPTASPGARDARSPAWVSRTSRERPSAVLTRNSVEPPRKFAVSTVPETRARRPTPGGSSPAAAHGRGPPPPGC